MKVYFPLFAAVLVTEPLLALCDGVITKRHLRQRHHDNKFDNVNKDEQGQDVEKRPVAVRALYQGDTGMVESSVTLPVPSGMDETGNDPNAPVKNNADQKRSELRNFFRSHRTKMHPTATTVTDDGEVIDWIVAGEQVPGGRLATPPPPEQKEKADALEIHDKAVVFELEQQPNARGPKGTVPVLRRERVADVLDDADIPKSIEEFLSKPPLPDDEEKGERQRGGTVVTFPDNPQFKSKTVLARDTIENFGGKGNINLWRPYVYRNDETTMGAVAVSRGSGSLRQVIEAGWMKKRNLYGDYETHFFVYYTTNNYQQNGDNKGGYNRDVYGFVQTSTSKYPGSRISTISTKGGTQYSLHFNIMLYNGNWWVKVGTTWVGYFPGSLFSTTGLRNGASQISWYGEVTDYVDNRATSTDMGSGSHAYLGWRYAAYMRNLKTYEKGCNCYRDFDSNVETHITPGCYTLDLHLESGETWGSYFYWGGSGYSGSCQNE